MQGHCAFQGASAQVHTRKREIEADLLRQDQRYQRSQCDHQQWTIQARHLYSQLNRQIEALLRRGISRH